MKAKTKSQNEKLNLNDAKNFAIATARLAGIGIMKSFNNITSIKTKVEKSDQLTSLVTNADIEADKIIIREIAKKYPRHSIITEEHGFLDNKSKYSWYIDPIDGTHNYIYGNPLFAVSIALTFGGKSVVGVVYLPYFDECYFAVAGKGSYLISKGKTTKLKATKKSDFKECMMVISSSFYLRNRNVNDIFNKLTKLAFRTRIHGASAIDLCYIASGKGDFFITFDIKPWDFAAGALIAEEAGAIVSGFDGRHWTIDDKNLLASNKQLHGRLVKIIND